MQLLLVRSLWAAPAVGLTSGTLKHTRAPSHAQRALSAACNTDHALCRVQRLCGAGFTCSPQSCKVVHEGPSSSSTCNIPHCIIKAIQTTRGVFGNACLPQGSARLDALVSLSWPRVRVCVIVSPPPAAHSSQPAPPSIWLLPAVCGKMGDAAFLCNYDRLAPLYNDFDSRGLLPSSLAPAGALQYPKNFISALRISIMWQTCFPSTCALDLFVESPWTSAQFTTSMAALITPR